MRYSATAPPGCGRPAAAFTSTTNGDERLRRPSAIAGADPRVVLVRGAGPLGRRVGDVVLGVLGVRLGRAADRADRVERRMTRWRLTGEEPLDGLARERGSDDRRARLEGLPDRALRPRRALGDLLRQLLAHLAVLARVVAPEQELVGERLAGLVGARAEGGRHVVDPGLHRLGEGVVGLLRIGGEEAAPDELGNPDRAPGQQEDGAGPHADEQRRVLLEALLQVERVAELVRRPLELGALGVDGQPRIG